LKNVRLIISLLTDLEYLEILRMVRDRRDARNSAGPEATRVDGGCSKNEPGAMGEPSGAK